MEKIILLEDFICNHYTKEKIPKGTKVMLVSDYNNVMTIRYKGYTYVAEKVRYEKHGQDNSERS